MMFAGSVGALSQSPDSYRPVQKTKSLTIHPTMLEDRALKTDLPQLHVVHEEAAALHRVLFGTHLLPRRALSRPAVILTALRPA